ncbi:MAG: DUF1036 domain-containing protein [Alphaproteobacteria bacterium]|nr:DUF1036 domain-containing protein [Alphaproteobacteria bacterium]
MRWIGVSVAALSFLFAAGAAIADHQGSAPGGGQGTGGTGTIAPRSTIPGYRLIATNRCSRTISMAYRVKDYTGHWVSRGWFHITPGRTRVLYMPTRNRTFYYYGYMQAGSNSWGGAGQTGSRQRWVRNKPFLHSSGNLSGAGARKVSYRKRTVPTTGVYKLNMTCRN